FLLGMICVTLATQLLGAVVAYQIYELTSDPLSLGMVGLAEALPMISLALVGGHFADAHDRRHVVLATLSVLALSAGLLVLLTERGAWLGSAALQWSIYGMIVLGGVCRSFLQPARAALNAELLPVSLYARAISVRTSAFQLSMALGPALGGLLYARVGPSGAYVVSTTLVLTGLALTWRISQHRLTPGRSQQRLPLGQSVREGLAFMLNDRILLSAQLLDLFAVLFGGATALLPVFANDILRVGSEGFGVLRAAPAVGAVLASLVLAARPPLANAGRTLLISVAAYGVTILGFGLSRSYALSVALLLAGGALDMVSVLVRSTLLQLRVPGPLLGRVASINQIFVGSSNEIGAFESGVAARLLGVIPSVLFGGSMTVLISVVTAWRAPELRRLKQL
ncbi:MAG TPA: MFS transporter, partial [Polyangiales bacterium]